MPGRSSCPAVRPDAVRFAGVLRAAIARHGIPRILYTDHGSCFTDSSLARTCTALGIKLTHSQPGRPMGRGEGRTCIRDYPAAVPGRGHRRRAAPGPPPGHRAGGAERPASPAAGCHARPHSGTGETPQARYEAAGPPRLPEPVLLREAFSWSAVRLVRNTATVSLEGNVYSVDPFLVGRKAELVFDPLSQGRDKGSRGCSREQTKQEQTAR